MERTRRELLESLAAAGIPLLAGCSSGTDGTPTPSATDRDGPTDAPISTTDRDGTTDVPTSTADRTTTTATETPTRTPTATEEPGLPPVDTDGLDFFVDGEILYPHGFNYIRLRTDADGNIAGHDTFNPDSYDPVEIERDLSHFEEHGFNLVRVFLDDAPGVGIIPEVGAESFSEPYVENLVDFLERAANHGIYALVTFERTPERRRYREIRNSATTPPNVEGANHAVLSPGHVDAHAQFVADVVAAVAERSPTALSAILAAHIQNEVRVRGTQRPFTMSEGTVTPANGETYDVSSDERLQALADEGFVHYANRHVEAVAEVAPGMNVCVGMFTYTPMAVSGPGDFDVPASTPGWKARIPPRPLALTESDLDFLDIHLYLTWAEQQQYDDIEIEALRCAGWERDTPFLMGEFGVWEDNYGSIDRAARDVRDWWERAAREGFAGYAYWTYKPNGQTLIMAMQDEAQIFEALTEAGRPADLRTYFACS